LAVGRKATAGESAAVYDPLFRGLKFPAGKVPNLCRHEMGRQMLGDISQSRVGYQTDFLNVLMMISYESKVLYHGTETFPTGEYRALDDETGEAADFFNVGIDPFGQQYKVFLFEGGFGSHVQNGMHSIKGMLEHVFAPSEKENNRARSSGVQIVKALSQSPCNHAIFCAASRRNTAGDIDACLACP
jgi:hypothetical protein